jgi:hypothetical protein
MKRPKLSYANVVASFALFVALGGTSYAALTLPRNSVGSRQIRSNAVGSSEVRRGAVHLADIAPTTRARLRGTKGDPGPAGPPGAAAVSYFAAVSGAGQLVRGNATSAAHTTFGSGSYTIGFPTNVSNCAYGATLGGTDTTTQPAGYITVRDDGGKVGVQIYDAAGNPADRPFHLIVAC